MLNDRSLLQHFKLSQSPGSRNGQLFFFPPVLFPYCPSLEILSFCWVYSIVTDGKNKAKNVSHLLHLVVRGQSEVNFKLVRLNRQNNCICVLACSVGGHFPQSRSFWCAVSEPLAIFISLHEVSPIILWNIVCVLRKWPF